MDEKIFGRLIPVVIAIVVLIVQYVIKNQKKKNITNATIPVPQAKETLPQAEINKQKQTDQDRIENDSLKTLVSKAHNITYDSKSNNKKPAFTAMQKNIKPSINRTIQVINNEKNDLTLTGEELQKAIIYSEILNPKYF